MTLTMPCVNGRKESRRSLSQELDRFDKMIDGLDKAIPCAIADAIKESVASAVAEAFRATLFEIASNPEIIALLRGQNIPMAQAAEQPVTSKPTLIQRLRRTVTLAWRTAMSRLTAAGTFIASPVKTLVSGSVNTYRQINQVWSRACKPRQDR